MEYIRQADYDYIINKYHDTAKPFDSLKRFVRRDELFSPETGLDPEVILAGITENDDRICKLPTPIRKAKALRYVLENTRVSCDSRDVFPAINMVDRPLRKTLIDKWRKETFLENVPEVEARRRQLERDGIVTIWPDYDHSVPVWERLFALGLSGILQESERIRKSRPRNAEQEAFFEGIKLTYEAVLMFLSRLEKLAKSTPGAQKMAHALQNLQHEPPKTFYEGLLLSYLYFMIEEHVSYLQVRSLSGFDRLYLDLYRGDLARGVSETELRTDLAYFMLQFVAIGNYWNQPLFLGGENADGSTVINELSYLVLDVYDKMGIYCPKIQIKLSDSTPRDFVCKALDMIRRGHNSIVFVSDNTIRRALMRAGATAEQARTCDVKGCYEYSIVGAFGCGMNYLNLLKPLEYALHEGRDGVTGVFSGMQSPPLAAYTTFDDLLQEYKRQLLRLIDLTVETVNGFEGYLAHINPQSMLSATIPSCLEQGKDVMAGGATGNGSTLQSGFLADAADSLMMIRKYVYERQELTLAELVAMLDADFAENERWAIKLSHDREKYGNNKERPDALAKDILDFIVSNTVGRPNAKERGGKWNCGFHVARQSYDQGKKTAASANGRRLGEELSKNISASMGQTREGATAAILSATKIDAAAFTCDAALDLGLLPSAVKGDDGLAAMYGLLMTFMHRGGHALQINVFNADTLRDAQAHPDKYQDLQIRVCGWNVLWNNINKAEQDGFIRQAEALV